MKKLTLILFVLVSITLNAQNLISDISPKPVYEKDGDLVKVTKFYETGEVKEQGFFDAEKRLTGKWVAFAKDGKKTTVAHYYQGAKVGKWLRWEGKKLIEIDYEGSRIANVTEWSDNEVIADN